MGGLFLSFHSTAKHAFDQDVFIYIRPMDSLAACYQVLFLASVSPPEVLFESLILLVTFVVARHALYAKRLFRSFLRRLRVLAVPINSRHLVQAFA